MTAEACEQARKGNKKGANYASTRPWEALVTRGAAGGLPLTLALSVVMGDIPLLGKAEGNKGIFEPERVTLR